MEQYRNAELDVAKGIAIILMVLGHMHFSDAVLNHYIYAFHMPIFFCISGMLFRQRDIKETIRSKARTLLMPYLVFGAGYWAIDSAIEFLVEHETKSILPALKSFLFFPTSGLAVESALWFLPVMFVATVCYCCLDRSIRNGVALSCTVLAVGIVGFTLPVILDFRLPWGMDTAMVALLFYHMGRLTRKYALTDRIYALKHKTGVLFYLGLVVVLAANMYLIFLNGKINMRTAKWANVPLTCVNAMTAVIAYIIVARLLADNAFLKESFPVRWLERISMTSIVYLCINHPMIRFARSIASGMAGDVPALQVVLTFVISMALMYGISELICRTRLRAIIGKGG